MRLTGPQAEDQALAYLQNSGLQLVARNPRCRGGEIDLVMQDGETLVFVEVRYRNSARFGSALESVTFAKQARVILAARHYLHRLRQTPAVRFDVVAIEPEGAALRVQWLRDAFRP